MGIKTEDFVPNMPGKDVTEGVDWLGILDGFDPSGLEQKYLDECARRNPYDTCYQWDTPVSYMTGGKGITAYPLLRKN